MRNTAKLVAVSIAFILLFLSSGKSQVIFPKEEKLFVDLCEPNKYCFKNNPVVFNISIENVIIDGNYISLDVNESYFNESLTRYKISYNFTYPFGNEKGLRLFITNSTEVFINDGLNLTNKTFSITFDNVIIDFTNETDYFNISYSVTSSGVYVNLTTFTTEETIVIDPTVLTTCYTITSPGEYVLTNDIIDSSASTCINIQSNDVILDCQGHTIDGVDDSNSYGIYVNGYSNTTIKNCIISDWFFGILLINSNYNNLQNITASSNLLGIFPSHSNYNTLTNITANFNFDSGLYIDYSNSSTLTNITANSNSIGLLLYSSNSNILTNITADSNFYGLFLYSSSSNTIKNSNFQNNSYGIRLSDAGASPNLIYNNIFNNNNNFFFDGTIYSNYWNTTLQPGPNIVGGPYIGGNYWGKPDGTGFSDTCSDSNSDGICDSPYTLATDNIDYLPLAKPPAPPTFSITFSYDAINYGSVSTGSSNNNVAEFIPRGQSSFVPYSTGSLNVTVTTNTNYKLDISSTNFVDGSKIISSLNHKVVAKMGYSSSQFGIISEPSISEFVTLDTIRTFTQTISTPGTFYDYHFYRLDVPSTTKAGSYSATVTITYSTV